MEDKIIISGLKIFAYHGVREQEKIEGQEFVIDCILYLDRRQDRFSDNIEHTISYSAASKIIVRAMQERKYNLIESAAENVAKSLFNNFEKLSKCEITLKKPHAPVKLEFDYMAVNILRKREDFID